MSGSLTRAKETQVTGELDAFGQLQSVERLYLSDTQLTGELADLASLKLGDFVLGGSGHLVSTYSIKLYLP